MSEPRYITIDFSGRIYPVVHLCDRFARDTKDPALAVTCVIEVEGKFVESDCLDVPIYTVH